MSEFCNCTPKNASPIIVLGRGKQKVLILRPETYDELIKKAQDYFPELYAPNVVVKTRDLEICRGELMEITPEVWDLVREDVLDLEVVDFTEEQQ